MKRLMTYSILASIVLSTLWMLTPKVSAVSLVDLASEIQQRGYPGITPSPEVLAQYESLGQVPPRVSDWAANPMQQQVTGTRTILVILIDFPDRVGTQTQAHYQTLLFGGSQGTLNHYYTEVSYSQLTVTGTIAGTGWYRSTQNMVWWGGDGANTDDANADIFELVREAVSLADANINFKTYDTNDNNVIDPAELSLCLVHAGGGQESSGVPTDIWSHRWYIFGSGYASPRTGAALADTFVDGCRISKHNDDDVGGYFMQAENSPMGTFAHEFGHDLGLIDLYDTDRGVDYGAVAGDWSLMDSGSWVDGGNTPAHLDPFSKVQLGWLDPIVVDSYLITTIEETESNTGNRLFRVDIPGTQQYFLVENREQTGYDTNLPEAGVLVWHIDGGMPDNDGPPGNSFYRVALEQPGGVGNDPYGRPPGDPNYRGALATAAYSSNDDQTSFNSTTTPNSNSNEGTVTSISVWNIGAEGPSISVTFFTSPFVPIDLALVLDRSGSMSGTMGTKTKMQGAKEAAIAVIDALMPGDRVAVVSFSSFGRTNVQLTTDFDQAKTEIGKIGAGGSTSFGAGMLLALNELKTRGSTDAAWAIIFMSNGWNNTSPRPDPYVAECKDLGIPIYAVGLGSSPGNVNEPVLKWMASETGGKYLFAPSLFELQNIFLRFSLEVTGWTPVDEFSGIVYEDQTVVAGTFDVAPFTVFTRVTLNWPGSDLDLILLRPDGSEVDLIWGLDNIYSGATAKPEWVILLAPQSGTWTVEVYGKIINSPDEPFVVWVSDYVPPTPIDTTPPTTSLEIGTPKYVDALGNVYIRSSTTLTLDAIDNSDTGSGVALTGYRYDGGWIEGVPPISFYIEGPDVTYYIEYNSTDNVGNVESTNTETTILDNSAPEITVSNPPPGWALQDGVTFMGSIVDLGSGVSSMCFSIRKANGVEGIPIGFECLPVSYDPSTGEWSLSFDTLLVPDGYYVLFIETEDNLGNTASTAVPYSIRNWAVIELLPASKNNKARRTMPVKFALRVAAEVDPLQPFVYNEELTIKIHATNNPDETFQESTFGDTARDYRISSVLYITNFKTLRRPMKYTVAVYRETFDVGSFAFETVK